MLCFPAAIPGTRIAFSLTPDRLILNFVVHPKSPQRRSIILAPHLPPPHASAMLSRMISFPGNLVLALPESEGLVSVFFFFDYTQLPGRNRKFFHPFNLVIWTLFMREGGCLGHPIDFCLSRPPIANLALRPGGNPRFAPVAYRGYPCPPSRVVR